MITEKELKRANYLKDKIQKIKIILKDFGVQKNGECKGLHYSYKQFNYPETTYMISELYTEFIDKNFKEAIQNANDSLEIEIKSALRELEEEYYSIIEENYDN